MNLGDEVRHIVTGSKGIITAFCQELLVADSVRLMYVLPDGAKTAYEWVSLEELEYVGKSKFSDLPRGGTYVGEGFNQINVNDLEFKSSRPTPVEPLVTAAPPPVKQPPPSLDGE